MSAQREYPETEVGPFPAPPHTFDDRQDRPIELAYLEDHHRPGLVEMYATFDPAQRAQGIPPSNPERIDPWLSTVLSEGVHVIACYGDDPIGHAMLVPDAHGAFELAIFVHQEFQGAGIGRRLLEHLLGAGEANEIERVWLTVERWNVPAIELYRTIGFETVRADRFDIEMALSLG